MVSHETYTLLAHVGPYSRYIFKTKDGIQNFNDFNERAQINFIKMVKRSRFYMCTVFTMCVIGCLQLANHFMMFGRSSANIVGCMCKCESDTSEKTRSNNNELTIVQSVAPAGHDSETDGFDRHVDGLLNMLDQMNVSEETKLGIDVEHLKKTLGQIKESRQGKLNKYTTPSEQIQGSEIQEICPEKFMGKSLDYGYPFFRKGFATLNCSQHVPLKDLITIVFDDLYTPQTKPPSYVRVLQGLAKELNEIKVVYITKNQPTADIKAIKSNVNVLVVNKEPKQGKIWADALKYVTTKYVLIAPNIDTFDDDIKLDRLVRVLNHNRDFSIASGAYRTRNGHWDIGCQQTIFRNYTMTFQGGYYRSHGECVLCDFTPAPWVARTQELREMQFDTNLDFGAFHDIFWKVKKNNKIAVSCPDVMFNIEKPKNDDDEKYLDFAKKYDLKKIVETNGRVRWYGCKRGIKHRQGTSCRKTRGLAVPPCDLENLADAVKLIMNECEKGGLLCELQTGSLLGAVKFNKVLPWERDADLTFHTANYSAFKKLSPIFKAAGYSFQSHDDSLWCCADNRQAGGKFHMSADGWSIQLYGQHLMESEMLVARGEAPTKVDFAGQMVTVVRNPGLYARNRYGEHIYMHQEHWLDRGKKSGWLFYNPGHFEKCGVKGHSGCLSQYSIDGNMQFDRNICPCSLENIKKP